MEKGIKQFYMSIKMCKPRHLNQFSNQLLSAKSQYYGKLTAVKQTSKTFSFQLLTQIHIPSQLSHIITMLILSDVLKIGCDCD